jgi:hypothetical protein
LGGFDYPFARARQLQRLRRFFRGMMAKVHVERDALPVFFQNRHGKAEAHDGEIHRRAVRGQRHNPSAFAAALIPHTTGARARETPGRRGKPLTSSIERRAAYADRSRFERIERRVPPCPHAANADQISSIAAEMRGSKVP